MRYGSCSAGVYRMGYGLFRPVARHVRDRAVDEVDETAGAGPRSNRNQAAIFRTPRRRPVLRFGTQSDPHPSGNGTAIEFGRSGLLSVAELRAVSLDSGRRHRKTSSGKMAGVAGWQDFFAGLLAIAARNAWNLDDGVGARKTGRSSTAIHPRTSAFGCSARH